MENKNTPLININFHEFKTDIDLFFQASMSALCHCYDHTDGFYPDSCDCDQSERVRESVSLLIEEHRKLIKKYDALRTS